MQDMIVVGFQGTHRANEVLNQVFAVNEDWAFDLYIEDAVAVYRTTDGKLRVDQCAGALTGGGAGAFIGSDDAGAEKEKYGITDNFVQQVGGMVQPGQSALFLLAESDEPAKVAEGFRGYGGTILRTTLRPEQEKQIQQVIGADRLVAR